MDTYILDLLVIGLLLLTVTLGSGWITRSPFSFALIYLIVGVILSPDKRIQKYRPVNEAMENFIALSIILITYAATELVHGYGFLAVFLAGMSTQHYYHNPDKRLDQLDFIEQFEKLAELGTILLLGSLLRFEPMLRFAAPTLIIAGLLLFVIRPVGAWVSTIGANYDPTRRWLFGCDRLKQVLATDELGEEIR